MPVIEKLDQGAIAEQLIAGAESGGYSIFMKKVETPNLCIGFEHIIETSFVPTVVDKNNPDGIHMSDWLDGVVYASGSEIDSVDYLAVVSIAMNIMPRRQA